MTDLAVVKFYFKIQFTHAPSRLFLFQCTYILKMMEKFEMLNYNVVDVLLPPGLKLGKMLDCKEIGISIYCFLVGIFIYLTNTRPDIFFVVSIFNRYMHFLQIPHLHVARHIWDTSKGHQTLVSSTWRGNLQRFKATLMQIGPMTQMTGNHYQITSLCRKTYHLEGQKARHHCYIIKWCRN